MQVIRRKHTMWVYLLLETKNDDDVTIGQSCSQSKQSFKLAAATKYSYSMGVSAQL